jgi:hypothetical protein
VPYEKCRLKGGEPEEQAEVQYIEVRDQGIFKSGCERLRRKEEGKRILVY